MAIDFIKVDRTRNVATHASLLLEYQQNLRRAYELGTKLKAILDHNQDGENWVPIENMLGLDTGKGQAVYNLINGSLGSMTGAFQTSDAKDITEILG